MMTSNDPVEIKYGVSGWGLIEIKEDVWINPSHIMCVRREDGQAEDQSIIHFTQGSLLHVKMNLSVADAVKRIAKLTMPMLYSLDDINPDPGLVDKMIGEKP